MKRRNYELFAVSVVLVALIGGRKVQADDWPTFRHDNRRSGFTTDKLAAPSLKLQWTWRSAQPPQPAWAGPAKWDSYAQIRNLPPMRDYDFAFQPIIVGGKIYFGSSADHCVRCLSAADGSQQWLFASDGPVRNAPTYADGKIYFGSDDGAVYCLDVASGQLVWRFAPVAAPRRFLNNGHFISPYPCRTGVVVDGGVAYFGAALLPWKEAYLCAVDAKTGSATADGCYVVKHQGLTFEGSPALSQQQLIMPMGRVAPRVFRRDDGQAVGEIKSKNRASGGGSVVMVSLDDKLFHGPAADSKRGGFQSSNPRTREMVAKYGDGKLLVVAGPLSYMATGEFLVAANLANRESLWKVPCRLASSLIGAGDVVVAGGEDELAAYDVKDGREVWRQAVDGKVFGLAAAGGRLLASTDTGLIYSFGPGSAVKSDTVDGRTGEATAGATEALPEPQEGLLATGPWLQFTRPGEATIRWRTAKPSPTRLFYRLGDQPLKMIEQPAPKTSHEVQLTDLKRNRTYHYAIQTVVAGRVGTTPQYECDTFFNYNLPLVAQLGDQPLSDAPSPVAQTADRTLKQSGVDRGICVLLGAGDGRLAHELARQSRLRVIAFETDREKVAAARKRLLTSGTYGQRAVVYHVESLAALPTVGRFANLIAIESDLLDAIDSDLAAEVQQLLRPDGGIALLGPLPGDRAEELQETLRKSIARSAAGVELVDDRDGTWLRITRKPLPGAGQWSHIYARTDNSAFGGEELGGAKQVDDLEIQWIGRPGPRYQADRSGRKPSPLSTGGRLFLQGLERIVALDTYNGSVLWSLEIPGLKRFNMPRDCSNWCADREHVFAVVGNQCWQIDAARGNVEKFFDVASPEDSDRPFDWGFIARVDQSIIGTALQKGTSWVDFWGGKGWYDAREGEVTHKICSDNLFSIDTRSGKKAWSYSSGVILNSSITIAGGRVFFIEARHEKVKDSPGRRIGGDEFWQDQHLVALDAASGKVLWQKKLSPLPGDIVLYMAHGQMKLVVTASSNKNFYVYAFSDADGEQIWQRSFSWMGGKGDHGKAISRPAIVGDALYVKPKAMRMSDGELLDVQFPAGKCGTYACTTNSLFFRTRTVTMWDRQDSTASTWQRLRPDCWLSTIPAAGMLLSPEGGGGCSCGNWLETSIGFMPVAGQR